MINFTNLISKVSKVSKVSQQNCESRMGTCQADAQHLPMTYLPVDSVSIVSRQSDLAKYVATLAVLLCLGIGNVWAGDKYYLFTKSGEGPAHTGSLSGDFYCQQSPSSSSKIIDGVTFSHCVAVSEGTGLTAGWTNKYAGKATIDYDLKTTAATFTVYAYNSNGSNYGVDKAEVEEGSTPTSFSQVGTSFNNSGQKITFNVTTTKNKRVRIGTNSNSNVKFYQIVVEETGTALPRPGQGTDYVLNFTTSGGSRYSSTDGSDKVGYIDGLEINSNKDSKYNTNPCTFAQNKTTNYIKFTTSATCHDTLIVTANNPFTYNTSQAFAGSTTASGTKIVLSPSTTYWILGQSGKSVQVSQIEFKYKREAACTAPNHVGITGTNKYLAGQEVSLTATAYSSAGTGSPIAAGNITGYQWQKEINSVWTDVTNGTSDGVTISGATTNNLRITPCNHYHSGQYRCVVSTGATCSTNSDAYGVHVFSIYGHYYGGEYSHNEITWTSGTTGTATIHLNASSTYIFKVWSNDGYYYGNGNNNYIIQPVNWDCGTGNSEMRLLTGPEGDYTFTVNIEHGLDGSPYVNLQVAYPSVSHPSTGYMYITKWWDHCYVHYWEGTNNDLSPWGYDPEINSDRYVNICGTNYWYFPVIDTYNKVIAKDAAGDPSNTTGDQVSTDHGGKYITHDGSWGWHDFATYTISFNNGGGTGTMSSITGLCPDADQALPANTFTKDDYIFTGWHANVATKVGDATIAAGGNIADEATLQDINSNITLTAQWTHCSGPSITAYAGSAGQTYTVGDVATAITVTASAGNGGTLHYHWYQYNVGQDPLTQSIDAVGGTDANTYTPSTASAHEGQIFYCVVSEEGCSTTVKSAYSGAITVNAAPTLYTVTYNVNGGGSVDPTSATQASVGASLTLPTPTWSGYTFEGWYNAGTKIGNAGASYTPTANITLYAHWTDDISGKVFSFIDNNYGDKFKAFDLSGWVTGGASKKDKTYTNATTGVQLVIDNGSWENKSNAISALVKQIGSGDKVSDIDIIIPTGKIATVKISYNAYGTGDGYRLTVNGTAQANPSTKLADGNTNAQVISNMKEITLSNQTGTLQLGVSNTSNNNYIGRVSAVITGYTISYAAGTYGSGSLASGTKTHGSNFTLSSNSSAFTRDGYTYDGWSINADGSTKDYNLGGTYSTDAAITLYPHWVAAAVTYSITYDCDGADSGCPSNVASAVTLPNPLPDAPVKAGYEFDGWYTNAGKTIAAVAGATLEDNITLYAKWVVDCKVSLSKVVLTSTSAGTVTGYNAQEFAGDAVIGGLSGSNTAEVDASHDGNETGYKLNNSGSAIVFATLKESFHEGDVVKVTITKQNDNYTFPSPISAKTGMDIYYGTNKDDATRLTTLSGVTGAGTYSYTLTAADITTIGSKKGIGVFRHSDRAQNQYVYSVEILGCREHATVYAFSNGSFTDWGTCNGGTLTLSGSQSGVNYQLYKDGVASGDAKAGTGSALNWTVTASGTYTVKSVANASYAETAMTGTAVVTLQDPALSGESSVEVGSTITLTHPGYLISGGSWTSSNGSVATVVDGVVTGVAAGTATITFHGVGACDGSKLITVTAAAVHHDVDFTLTNVTYSSGDNEGTDAATEGSVFSTVFAASSGYSLPGTITVTIGGSPATVSTDYTWNQGTGTLTIPAANVTGDITVTIVGEELEGDGCEDLVSTEAATATSLSTSVGTATLSNPSSQSKNSKAIKLNSSGYIELSPKAGKSFAVGDSLIVVVYNQATSGKTTGFKIGSDTYTASIAKESNHTFRQKLTGDNIVSSKVKIERESSDGWFVSIIIKHCEDLPSCTTPTLPSLSDQELCPGSDIAAWDATATNAATITAAGEDIAYSWKKKGNDTELATTASFDLGSSATEGQAGTYVVTVTVSATGKVSKSASAEVDLVVTPATETPSVSANKAKVYQGDEVTLTATCGSTGVTWQWYTCSNAEGASESSISGAMSAAYTIASAGVPGTYYYKVKATGDGTHSCGVAEYVYTLTVSAPSECENYFWFVYADDATSNGVINNRDGFFSGTKTGSSNQGSYKFTLDGTEYTATRNTGSSSISISFTVPTGATAILAMNAKSSSSNTVTLSHSSGTPSYDLLASGSYTSVTKDEIGEGTWTLTAPSNWTLAGLGVHVCSASTCTDAIPTATATNTTVCSDSELSITATGYEESPNSIQWQKLNSSTSTWDNISGATSATYTVASAAAANAGSYRVVVTKECARTSNTVTIAVPSAPEFGAITSPRTVMETQALSINDVEASDATTYRWYKSANNMYEQGTDVEVGTVKNLILASGGETSGATYYLFCIASNSCGSVTSSAIQVNVTTLVEEDCATKGNEAGADFGFENTGCGSGNFPNTSTSCWNTNSKSKYLTYTAPEGKYFDKAKVTVGVSGGTTAAYGYSTDGSSWTYVTLTGLTTSLAEKEIGLTGNITHFRIGRNFDPSYGQTSNTFYLSKACFEYTESCTSTTVTVSPTTKTHTIGSSFSKPTITLTAAAVAAGGTLTYSSSNEDIATVDDDGSVNFQDRAGTVKITASYAGDATYCASEGSYTITVSCSDEAPKVVASGTNVGCNTSITLNAKMQNGTSDFADGTYQWFRDGEEIVGATLNYYSVTREGVYIVERTSTGGCTSVSSNSVTVTSETTEPDVERLVPFQYYHVDTIYPEASIMRYRHLFAVKNSGTRAGKKFDMTLSRSGAAATNVTSSNAFYTIQSADHTVDTVMIDLNKLASKYSANDELVLTCSAIDCSGNVSATIKETITIHVIDATPTLALICSGASGDGTRTTSKMVVGGDFLTGYNKADLCQQTDKTSWDKNTEWGLYTELKDEYIVTPVNGYAVFNKLNYEPFDICFLTDYPKASKSTTAALILDDMSELVDFRPLFSFKTHMVQPADKLDGRESKWKTKGFTTLPTENKADGRLNLNIVCYAHPMFNDLKGGTDFYNDDDDRSQLVYTMLTGEGYESKKGMQGFEIDAAENFVTIGLTHYNATMATNNPSTGYAKWTAGDGDRMLVTAAERQKNIDARMILFSLNAGAHSKLTEKGEHVVLACLEYLLEKDPIKVADCALTFDNGANYDDYNESEYHAAGGTGSKGDGLWSTRANWGPEYANIPGKFNAARIAAPVIVDLTDAKAMELRIMDGGHITIPAGSALEVTSTIRRLDGGEISPTENSDIFIGSTSAGNGTLIFNNDKGDSKATVAMYTTAKTADPDPVTGKISAAASTWQYIGTPHNDVAVATYNYYDSWLYQYDTGTQGWVVIPNGGPLVPFRGYCVTHPEANHTFVMGGKLTATTSADIEVPANKFVVAANSWVAPIDINKFTDDDFEGISDKTIYFFNTGSDTEGNGGTGTAAGTYRASPIKAAAYTGDWQIPSMQGFYIGSTTAGTLHLDYDRHVRQNGDSKVGNPMYAPQRFATNDEPVVAKLYFRGSRYFDRLVVLEREDFTRGYDSGWDGEAWGGNSASPLSCVSGEGRWDAVSAIPEFEGTVVGFQAGEDNAYTIDFEYSEEYAPLYLYDTEAKTYSRVLTGNAYYFTTSDKDYHDRFFFTRNAPSVITGIEPTSDSSLKGRAKKLLIEDKLFILLNGVLYDATGKVVK